MFTEKIDDVLSKFDHKILQKQSALIALENAEKQMKAVKKMLSDASFELTKEIQNKITPQDLIGKEYVYGSYSIEQAPRTIEKNNQFFIDDKLNTYYDYAECVDNSAMRKIVNLYTKNFEFQHKFFEADNYLLLAVMESDNYCDGDLRRNLYKFNFIAI